VPACGTGVRAQGQDGGGDRVGGRGDHSHLVRLSQIGGFRRGFQRLIPASGIDVQPAESRQAATAGAPHARCPQPVHGVGQHRSRQAGFVKQPRSGTESPQGGLVQGSASDPPQVRDELAPAAMRVGAGQGREASRCFFRD
jgi:hypothetical protein